MKIILFSRSKVQILREDIDEIFSSITRHGFSYIINREFAETLESQFSMSIRGESIYDTLSENDENDSVMVCYGGDGTILEGVHMLCGFKKTPVIGINSGHLGFLSTAPRSEIGRTFTAIANSELDLEERTALEVEGIFDGQKQTLAALNEVSLQRLGATMISIDTSIDSQRVLTCNGDGIIIATPTGSTAYSLSAGGPVVSPACRCLLLTPLSPHNLTMRPVVIPDSSTITLSVNTRSNVASVSIDNRTFEVKDGARFTVKLSPKSITLAVPHNISFYDTLRNKMMWGVDIR